MSESLLTCNINGESFTGLVDSRTSLADFLREQRGLTGTHVACGHGVCGACTVFLDAQPVRACICLAVTVHERTVTTVEGLTGPIADSLRKSFTKHHALQCGYCTPGMLVTAIDIVTRKRAFDEASVRTELAGNLCRCTGYQGIVAAILDTAATVETLEH